MSTPAGKGTPSSARRQHAGATEETSEAVAAAKVMQQVLDQMEKAFESDHTARRQRILELEQKQRELENLCKAAAQANPNTGTHQQHQEDHQRHHPHEDRSLQTEKELLAEEVQKYAAQYEETCNTLAEDVKVLAQDKKRLQIANENLDDALRRARNQNSQLQSKVEQLARNVVRTLKERQSLLQETDAQRATIEDFSQQLAHQKALAQQGAETATLLTTQTRENEMVVRQLQMAELEVKRLSILLEKHQMDDKRARKDLVEGSDKVVAEITHQLNDLNTQRELLLAQVSDSQLVNERLAEELKQMIFSRRERDERVSQLERELTDERTRRLAMERQINYAVEKRNQVAIQSGALPTSPAAEVGDLYDARREVLRLQGLLDRQTLEAADTMKSAQQRIEHLSALYEQATERCKGYENSLLELRQIAATANRDKMKQSMIAQTLRQRILVLQAEGANTAASVVSSKSDVEEAIANATNDLALRFAQQVHKDFASMAYFFSQLKAFDPELILRNLGNNPPPAGLIAPGFSSPMSVDAPVPGLAMQSWGASAEPSQPSASSMPGMGWNGPRPGMGAPSARQSPAAGDVRSAGLPTNPSMGSTRSGSVRPLMAPTFDSSPSPLLR